MFGRVLCRFETFAQISHIGAHLTEEMLLKAALAIASARNLAYGSHCGRSERGAQSGRREDHLDDQCVILNEPNRIVKTELAEKQKNACEVVY